ncbi:MAG: hypothetical protein HQK83_13295 [Fibrobacteria bacterium]|nr:hypothetical protein [Fibrobacteria bacterium]
MKKTNFLYLIILSFTLSVILSCALTQPCPDTVKASPDSHNFLPPKNPLMPGVTDSTATGLSPEKDTLVHINIVDSLIRSSHTSLTSIYTLLHTLQKDSLNPVFTHSAKLLENEKETLHNLLLFLHDSISHHKTDTNTVNLLYSNQCDSIPAIYLDENLSKKLFHCAEAKFKGSTQKTLINSNQYYHDLIRGQLAPLFLYQLISEYASLQYLAGNTNEARNLWKIVAAHNGRISELQTNAEEQLDIVSLLLDSLSYQDKLLVEKLYKTYLDGKPYNEISMQALALLKEIKTPRIRKEIKKIVSSAWDRDKSQIKMALKDLQDRLSAGENPSLLLISLDSLQIRFPNHDARAFSNMKANFLKTIDKTESLIPDLARQDQDSLFESACKLIEQEDYLSALNILKKIDDINLREKVKNKLITAGNRYCTEKRQEASLLFRDYRKVSEDSLKIVLLTNASQALNSCLVNFPDSETIPKVKKNITLIHTHLEKLTDE